ncbi:MAG: HD domain-containing phosphohydrolase [Lachnospiraceae bacterium]
MNTVSVERLLEIGIALSKEKDNNKLFELILMAAMDITNCDGGTLYRKEAESLAFTLMFTRSNGTKQGGCYGPILLPPVPLLRENICACAALDDKLINICDVYESETFNFSGPKNYDAMTGYRTTSMLVVPMKDDENNCIGVLQLINALDEAGEICSFDKSCEQVILSLASQTAICQVNMAYATEIQELLDSLVYVISTTIDALAPYNANHTNNMVKYGERFIDWLKETNQPWQFNEQERRQFLMSVWLHDSGKITVPLQVMDKETRLGDALAHLLDRFRIMALLDELAWNCGKIEATEYEFRKQERLSAQELILKANVIGFLNDEMFAQIKDLGNRTYVDENNKVQPWLMESELIALSVRKGTLTAAERHIMENHVVMTDKILSKVKFPKNYSNVKEWAQNHHEFLNGTGYPKGLHGDEISVEVRLITILDIFDALTARDRPYKPAMSVEKALEIMDSMEQEGKLDKRILTLFKISQAWEGTM